jgi:VanW like protein
VKLIWLAAIVTVATIATGVAVEVSGLGERIPAGVRVDGVEVGGLSPADATRRLEIHASTRRVRPVLVEGPRGTIATSGGALGAKARIDEALAAAGRIGRIRHWLGSGREREIPLRFDLSAPRVRALAARLGAVPAVNAGVEVDRRGIHVRAGSAGRAVDVTALQAGLSTLPARVRVRTVAVPPRVTTSDATAAAERARRLVDEPRTIVVGPESHTLTPAELHAALAVRRAEQGFTIGFDPVRLARFLPAPQSPRDAQFSVEGSQVRVLPSAPGRTVDAAGTALALADPSRTTVAAAVVLEQPAVTTGDLTALGIRERISTFTTIYPPGQPRVVNIRRAASVIDGTILRPGETFSMNQVLGERTIEKGYVAAPQIVGSSFADSVGGGISQVATMLYNGAFFAGLELIEHQPHSLYIDRYPLGREATISWGGPELIFRNDWPAGVLIDLEASEGEITIQLFSSRLGRRVETETLAPYGHGGGGFIVEYTRRVYRGSRLLRDERFRVHYGVAAEARGGR